MVAVELTLQLLPQVTHHFCAMRFGYMRGHVLLCLALLNGIQFAVGYRAQLQTETHPMYQEHGIPKDQWMLAMSKLIPTKNFVMSFDSADLGLSPADIAWYYGTGGSQQPKGRTQKMGQVIDCWNSQSNFTEGTTWLGALSDDLTNTNLKIAAAWWNSNVKRKWPVTVCTSATITRLNQLEAQCKGWSGPTSAVLYVPLLSTGGNKLTEEHHAALRLAVLQITQFLDRSTQIPGTCKPDILLVWEMFAEENAMHLLYPVNILRSLARLQAQTPLVAGVDVDLIISRSWAERFKDKISAAKLVEQADNKTAFIIPLFDVAKKVDRASWADAMASAKKDIIVAAYKMEYVFQFDKKGFPQGHGLVDFDHWITATEDYPVKHEFESEPFLVGARTLLPWHDARYRGYGKNKVQYVADVSAKGFDFKVFHDAYMLHRYHKKSDAFKMYVKDKHADETLVPEDSLFSRAHGMYMKQIEDHRNGVPVPSVIHPAAQYCRSVLPWWNL